MGILANYEGHYTDSNDTIYLQYQNSKRPKNELPILLRKDNSIMVLEIYDAIKNEYSDYSADQLNKIDKKDLMTKDTAMVEYKKR
jgi:hypothetical protein